MVGLMLASQASMTMGTDATGLPEIFGADGYVTLPVLGGSSPASGLGGWSAGITPGVRTAVFVLLGLGFLVKTGAMGLHIWLPDAYTEADDDVTVLLSSALSKAGILGMIVLLAMVGAGAFGGGGVAPNVVLGWIGALTALFGALLAVFQEDVKKLLAYSSLSQVGSMILGIALATHLGWLAGIYQAINHFIFKGLLFLAITGVIMRTGSRYMYQMGGLIKRMPLSFISALMAIIALSGVPPLSGFGGKWLIYGALLESEWFIQAGIAFFASTIAFLYLFRMIYTVFLGQLKDNLREVREAPAAVLIPQIILMAVLMLISMYPNLIINPIIEGIEPYLATTVRWDDYTVVTALGYWNGNAVMWVTMGVFILPLVWLMIVMRRPQKVKQFNIVFAAERPERPETTHFAHNFFAPYRKALGFLVAPVIMRGWEYAIDGVRAISTAVGQIYTGNGQTYALHILLLTVALYFIAGGM
jgi:formate hydrogenlyase subunit 3/multisubunit Na+/H+ antiporter MnhD subunit